MRKDGEIASYQSVLSSTFSSHRSSPRHMEEPLILGVTLPFAVQVFERHSILIDTSDITPRTSPPY
eukprot:1994757-Amphidinium_carterae.1